MVGLNQINTIKRLLNNNYIITEKFLHTDLSDCSAKKSKIFFISEVYRLNCEHGGVYEINSNNFNSISIFDFEEVYVYLTNRVKFNEIRIQLKHFMDNVNFYFPDTKRHIILEKKM